MLRLRAIHLALLCIAGLPACGGGASTSTSPEAPGEGGHSGAGAGGSAAHSSGASGGGEGGANSGAGTASAGKANAGASGGAEGGTSGATSGGPECQKLVVCCATLGVKRAACEDIAANDAGVEANCRVSHDLLCPTHTCADLRACCQELQGQAQTNCLAAANELGDNDPECSVAYGSLPECNP